MSETTVIERPAGDTTEKRRFLDVLIAARDGKTYYPSGVIERQFVESLKRSGKLNARIQELETSLGIVKTPTKPLTKTEQKKEERRIATEQKNEAKRIAKEKEAYWKNAGPGRLAIGGRTRKRRSTRKSKKSLKARMR
jgi:hypothetical protein